MAKVHSDRSHTIRARIWRLLFVLCLILAPLRTTAQVDSSPKVANYFLKWELTESDARALSKWDLVILDMEIQYRSPDLLKKMREWNPDIQLLVYITPQEIRTDAATSYSVMRQRFAKGLSDSWYLKNSSGTKLSWWPGTYLLNVTNSAPLANGQRYNDYVSSFVTNKLLSTGYWDGVFYDNSWDNISYFAGTNIDLTLNGVIDSDLDNAWRDGMRAIYDKTRQKAGDDILLIGNNDNTIYLKYLNGKLLENFSGANWAKLMNTAAELSRSHKAPQMPIVNANTGNSGIQDYQAMRYGLGSSLLENVYFSYDYGDRDHGQTWWFDEYDVDLGNPLDAATAQSGATSYVPDVWQREFEHGIAVVNSLNTPQLVSLDGEYEHLRGSQDPSINDGSIVSSLTISGEDGRILLKTFETINDILFPNGDFVHFLRPDGSRVRNGFFVFDESRDGGEQVAHIDLNGDGKRDLFVVDGNKIVAWRHDGQPYINPFYPYTANYTGTLRVTLGDINEDGKPEIYVAPEAGYPAPIKVYTRYGFPLRSDWYPYGTGYSGGYSLAIGNFHPGETGNVILGSGTGVEPRVGIYTWDYKIINSWLAFESNFRGGIDVAAGDLDGSGVDEVIVGAGSGKPPVIRTFDMYGTAFAPEFQAYSSVAKNGISVDSQDVDFDGKDDIIGFSSGL